MNMPIRKFNVGESSSLSAVYHLPWPAVILDRLGTIIGFNLKLLENSPSATDLMGLHFRDEFPEHNAVLHGDPPWLHRQQHEVRIDGSSGPRIERIHVCPLDDGISYVIFTDETRLYELEAEATRNTRLASLGFMLAGACHELSNPLAATHSMVQLLRSEQTITEEMQQRIVDNIANNVGRMLDVSRRVTGFSRTEVGTRRPVRIDDIIDEALDLIPQNPELASVKIERERDPDAVVACFPSQLRQVFLNIGINAAQAMSGNGTLFVRTHTHFHPSCVHVLMEDTGPGIPESSLSHLFEPFFTTKPEGCGTGLGLVISDQIVREHDGHIYVSNGVSGGACFRIQLPLAAPRR